MAKYAIVNKDNFSIKTIYTSDSGPKAWGGEWGNSDLYEHVLIDVDLEGVALLAQDDGNGGIELLSDDESRWNSIRAKRDELLKQSDWTQLSDSPLSAEEKTEWSEYRQDLRDLPQTYEEDIDLLEWPTTP